MRRLDCEQDSSFETVHASWRELCLTKSLAHRASESKGVVSALNQNGQDVGFLVFSMLPGAFCFCVVVAALRCPTGCPASNPVQSQAHSLHTRCMVIGKTRTDFRKVHELCKRQNGFVPVLEYLVTFVDPLSLDSTNRSDLFPVP